MTPSLLLAVLASGFIYGITPGCWLFLVLVLPVVDVPEPDFYAVICWAM